MRTGSTPMSQGGAALAAALCLVLGAVPAPVSAQAGERIQPPDSSATVSGTVLDHASGAPLYGATVSLAAGPGGTRGIGTRVTDPEGRFSFARVPAGSYRLVVTLLGYRELQDTLPVAPWSELAIDLRLSVAPVELAPVVVVVRRRPPLVIPGFEERRRSTAGTFITRSEIERQHPVYVSDLLRTVPGVRVVPLGTTGNTIRLRGSCRPEFWLDGVKISDGMGVDFFPPGDLEAIEVYRGVELPAAFGANNCGGVLLWTRLPGSEGRGGSFWKRLAFAGGFVALWLLLTH